MSNTAVLFDLDGTLIDTAADFAWVLNQLLTQNQRRNLNYTAIRKRVSDGASAMIKLGFACDELHPQFTLWKQQFLDLYEQNLARESQLFPGMQQVLSELAQNQIPWGIVTNKPRRYADALLKNLNLDQHCACLICPDDVSQTKPNPEGLLAAAEQLGIAANKCWYVGDHQRDIEAAHNAGMKSVAASYGYVENMDQVKQWQAMYCIDQPVQLLQLVN